VRRDVPGGARDPRDDATDPLETLGDRAEDQPDRRAHERPSRDATDILAGRLQSIPDGRIASVQADHRGADDGGVEVDRNEEREEVDDREADIEGPTPGRVRRGHEEEDRPEEMSPYGAGDQEGEKRKEDEPFLLAQDAEAHLREGPPDPEPLEEAELPRGR